MAGATKATRPRELSIKQKKFIKAKAQGKTGVAAAQEAYGVDYNSAKVIASNNLTKVNIQEALHAEMTKQGITLEAIVKPIKDGLVANKIIVMGKESADSFVDLTPDHSIRLKASGMAAQFMGISRGESGTTNVNFINVSKGDKGEYSL